jgi:hypothetical protein
MWAARVAASVREHEGKGACAYGKAGEVRHVQLQGLVGVGHIAACAHVSPSETRRFRSRSLTLSLPAAYPCACAAPLAGHSCLCACVRARVRPTHMCSCVRTRAHTLVVADRPVLAVQGPPARATQQRREHAQRRHRRQDGRDGTRSMWPRTMRASAPLRADGRADLVALFAERQLVHVAAPMVRYSKYAQSTGGGAAPRTD